MKSPYQIEWRLQDVIAAIQVMGSSAWSTRRMEEWEDSLGFPRSAETWDTVLSAHPEFFSVRFAPWIETKKIAWKFLIAKLRDPQDDVSRYLSDQISGHAKEVLGNYQNSAGPSDELKTVLIRELNSVIRRREFQTEPPFRDLRLPPEVVLPERLPPTARRMILNRTLLEVAIPQEVSKHNLELRATLTWRSAFDKNYSADDSKELTAEDVSELLLEERDRLSRRPLDAEEIHTLVTTALEMHARVLAQKQDIRWWIPIGVGVLLSLLGILAQILAFVSRGKSGA